MKNLISELAVKRGEFIVIRVDGNVTHCGFKPTNKVIKAAIGCDLIDVVILTHDNGMPGIVMICDDTGMIDGKPVNPKATALYHSVCRPGTTHQIHGDVALVFDEDFG